MKNKKILRYEYESKKFGCKLFGFMGFLMILSVIANAIFEGSFSWAIPLVGAIFHFGIATHMFIKMKQYKFQLITEEV